MPAQIRCPRCGTRFPVPDRGEVVLLESAPAAEPSATARAPAASVPLELPAPAVADLGLDRKANGLPPLSGPVGESSRPSGKQTWVWWVCGVAACTILFALSAAWITIWGKQPIVVAAENNESSAAPAAVPATPRELGGESPKPTPREKATPKADEKATPKVNQTKEQPPNGLKVEVGPPADAKPGPAAKVEPALPQQPTPEMFAEPPPDPNPYLQVEFGPGHRQQRCKNCEA